MIDPSVRKKIIISFLVISGVLTVVICLVMNFAIIPKIEAGNPPMRCFDMCTRGYTVEDARAFVAWLPHSQSLLYRNVQLPLDFFYPIAYTVFFSLLWIVLHGKANFMLALPVALGVTDYVENSLVWVMLNKHTFSDAVIRVASWATMIKTVLMYLTILVLVITAIVALLRAIRRKRLRKEQESAISDME